MTLFWMVFAAFCLLSALYAYVREGDGAKGALGPKVGALIFGFIGGFIASWMIWRIDHPDEINTVAALDEQPALGYVLPMIVALDVFEFAFTAVVALSGAVVVMLGAVLAAWIGGLIARKRQPRVQAK